MIRCQLEIINKLGLHARAATKLAAVAGHYLCTIRTGTEEPLVDAKSIMSVMMLAAGKGTVLDLKIEGPDEEAALKALTELIDNRFDEPE